MFRFNLKRRGSVLTFLTRYMRYRLLRVYINLGSQFYGRRKLKVNNPCHWFTKGKQTLLLANKR